MLKNTQAKTPYRAKADGQNLFYKHIEETPKQINPMRLKTVKQMFLTV